MFTKKFSIILIITIILTLGLSISLGSLLAAWTSPSSAPPDGNVAALLNTSAIGQSKQGGLILNTAGGTNALIIQSGKVGIGTTDPQATLDIDGNIDVSGSISVTGNIIAAAPTADNHLTTKGYVDASGGGATSASDGYLESKCADYPDGTLCNKIGTIEYICSGDYCIKTSELNDGDGDGIIGWLDCDDNNNLIGQASDNSCDGDGDGYIDYTAGGDDCFDNDYTKVCEAVGEICSVPADCATGYCYVDGDTDGYSPASGGTMRCQDESQQGSNDCNDNDITVYQTAAYYPDSDGDGYYSISSTALCAASPPSGYSASQGDDCDDDCKDCYLGSTKFTTQADGLDQDCENGVDDYYQYNWPVYCSDDEGHYSDLKLTSSLTYCSQECKAKYGSYSVAYLRGSRVYNCASRVFCSSGAEFYSLGGEDCQEVYFYECMCSVRIYR